jgi:hypothetical protein
VHPGLRRALPTLLVAALAAGCGDAVRAPVRSAPDNLTGQWRATIHFESGAFASVHDLEFMYVFNAGGTMTESSNYDGAPPVPPAYGIWRRTGARQYEAKYEFYATKAPAELTELTKGGGWRARGDRGRPEVASRAPREWAQRFRHCNRGS